MSVDAYMKASLANQERIISLLEALVAKSTTQVVLQPNHQVESTTVGGISETKVTPVKEQKAAATATAAAGSTETRTSEPAQSTARQESSGSSSKSAPSEDAQGARLKADGKKVTADDARKMVKAFAAIEGNEAAVELLASFNGAGSVSAVADQGDEALASLYFKAGGK